MDNPYVDPRHEAPSRRMEPQGTWHEAVSILTTIVGHGLELESEFIESSTVQPHPV